VGKATHMVHAHRILDT